MEIKELMTKHEKLTKTYNRFNIKHEKIIFEYMALSNETHYEESCFVIKKRKLLADLNFAWDNLIENHKKIELSTKREVN